MVHICGDPNSPCDCDCMNNSQPETPRDIAKQIAENMACNCNLDCWQPEPLTGHSWVCRIHKATVQRLAKQMKA